MRVESDGSVKKTEANRKIGGVAFVTVHFDRIEIEDDLIFNEIRNVVFPNTDHFSGITVNYTSYFPSIASA